MNTPTKTRGVGAGKAADLTYWEGAARMIASVSKTSKIVIEKSTVPVKTAEAIEKVLLHHFTPTLQLAWAAYMGFICAICCCCSRSFKTPLAAVDV